MFVKKIYFIKAASVQVKNRESMMFRIVFWDVLPCRITVDNYFTRQYIPKDNSEHHTRRRENLKSHRESMVSHKNGINHKCCCKNMVQVLVCKMEGLTVHMSYKKERTNFRVIFINTSLTTESNQ
jgi:hypothetical protein